MCLTINSFVSGCSTCQHIKDSTQHTPGLLQPHPIPFHYFDSWSLDLITDLPSFHGCNTVFTYVNCLTKLCRLTPCFLGGFLLGTGEVACHFFNSIV